ncbi:hypothetical protein O6H91_03G077200 [Diphasiastrum complanatum]|nr:hypothetical protein O6H91_03G077200 [Diphasiastrum complanatum]
MRYKTAVAVFLFILLCLMSRKLPRHLEFRGARILSLPRDLYQRKLLDLDKYIIQKVNTKANAADTFPPQRPLGNLLSQNKQAAFANAIVFHPRSDEVSTRGKVRDLHSVPSSPNPIQNENSD